MMNNALNQDDPRFAGLATDFSGLAGWLDRVAERQYSEDHRFTDEQQLWLCAAAGVPIDSRFDPESGRMVFSTRHPCAVKVVQGKIRVFVDNREANV